MCRVLRTNPCYQCTINWYQFIVTNITSNAKEQCSVDSVWVSSLFIKIACRSIMRTLHSLIYINIHNDSVPFHHENNTIINTLSDRNRLVKWAKVLRNFWPYLGVDRTNGSKVMGKNNICDLNFFLQNVGPEVGVVDPRGTSGLTSPTFPSNMDRIRQAVPKLLNLQ